MVFRRVVEQGRGRGKLGNRAHDDVRLGWVKVAARRIATKGPRRAPSLLPSGDGQRVVQKLGQRAKVDGRWCDLRARSNQRPIRPIRLVGIDSSQRDAIRPPIVTKRVGLGLPVEIAEGWRKPVWKTVLCAQVITSDGVGRVFTNSHRQLPCSLDFPFAGRADPSAGSNLSSAS